MSFRNVTAQLGNMRKPQEFTVYPKTGDGRIIVQSDKSIGQFDPETGKGVLNTRGCYFPHLSGALGAQEYDFPDDFVEKCREITC